MPRTIGVDQYLNMLSERVIDNSRQLKRGVHQRRNGMEDLYGIEFTRNGDANHPATFYISISPDLVYYERFDFKFIIGAYQSSVAGITLDGQGVEIGDTSLAVNVNSGSDIISGTSTLEDFSSGSVSPNPHKHPLSGGSITGGASYGIKQINTTSANWRLVIHGVDVTDYLREQHNGDFIDMTGASGDRIFPGNSVADKDDFYDILDVACMLDAEGNTTDRDKLIRPEFKKVELYSDAPFSVSALLYLKYSHINK